MRERNISQQEDAPVMIQDMTLDQYDDRPAGMKRYLSYYGWHFTRKMCEFAVQMMQKGGSTINPLDKSSVDNYLQNANITLEHNKLYDYVYVANMAYSDFYGSSIQNDIQLARYIKDYIDDEDAYDGMPFSRFYIDTVKKGVPIDWEDMM